MAIPADEPIRRRWQYWPEIDGLRTIAVLSVFLFHLARPALPGGFVGVDIFFVISGFLIGSILLDDIARDRFSIATFYRRRISRIFPALLLVIVATLLAGALLYSAQDLASLGVNGAAAAASVINLKLMVQGDYFAISADAQPLMHYWSLALEEQFYVVFPILLYLAMRFTRRPLAIMLAVAAASFAASIWATATHPTFAFYALPTRAWELLAGSSLALYRARGGRLPAALAPAAAWSGAALIALSLAVIDEHRGFPGWIAAVPVLGAALLIAPVGDARPLPLTVLARPWMVWIGKRSYALYLWHWPVFSFVDYRFFTAGEPLRVALKLAISVTLALLSYRIVEQPARAWLNGRSRPRHILVGTALLVGLIVGLGIWMRTALYYDVPPGRIAAGGVTVRGGDRATVILSGDSQAAMYGTMIGDIARARGFTLHALGTAGKNQLPGEPESHWAAAAQLIREKKPDLVILVDAWSAKLGDDPARLRRALADIAGSTRRVLLITQPPMPPAEATREGIRGGARPPFAEPAESRRRRLAATAIVHGMATATVRVVDVDRALAAPDGGVRMIAADGRLTYHDPTHLTDRGTALTRPAIDAAIADALGQR